MKIESNLSALNEIETLIRQGSFAEAKKAALALIQSELPIPDRIELARLLRRSNAAWEAFRLLRPLVIPSERGKSTLPKESKEQRIAADLEFSCALHVLGANREARQRLENLEGEFPALESLNPTAYFRSLLYRSFIEFSEWDENSAYTLLKQVISNPKFHQIPDYDRKIIAVNFFSATVGSKQYAEAEKFVQAWKSVFFDPHTADRLLRGNVREIWARALIDRKRIDEAKALLKESLKEIRDFETQSALFIEKWLWVCDLKKATHSLKKLDQRRKFLIAKAQRLRHAETLRDLDRQWAKFTNSKSYFLHLYYGTPYAAYRKTLTEDFKLSKQWIQEGYDGQGPWKVNAKTKASPRKQEGVVLSVKEGTVVHRLWLALTTDFYRARSWVTLFSEVFPEQKLHPTSSSLVFHQALKRLRFKLRNTEAPLKITEKNSLYRIQAESTDDHKLPVLKISAASAGFSPHERSREVFLFKSFQKHFQNPELSASGFTTGDVQEALKISKRTATRALQVFLEKKQITRTGTGRSTRYRFADILSTGVADFANGKSGAEGA